MKHTFQIPLYALPEVTKTIVGLNKKAAKLGCPEIKLSLCPGSQKKSTKNFYVREQGSSEINPSGTTVVETVEIEVEFQTIIREGWTPVCRIEHVRAAKDKEGYTEKTENVVYPAPCHLPPDEIRASAKDREPVCDHCKVKRHRNETFILWNADAKASMQVGSTCLADFIGGTNADQALATFAFMSSVVTTIFDECNFDGERGAPYHRVAYDTDTTLQVIAHVIRLHGYLSKKDCTERHQQPTSQIVREWLRDHVWAVRNFAGTVKQYAMSHPTFVEGGTTLLSTEEQLAPLYASAEHELRGRASVGQRQIQVNSAGCNRIFVAIPLAITDADRSAAAGCRALLMRVTETEGYMSDLRDVVSNDLVSEAKLGLLTSAIPTYMRLVAREDRRTRFEKSVAVGKPEERLTLQLRYVNSKFFPAQPEFGRSEVTLVEFTDEGGKNLYTWWTSSSITPWKIDGLVLAKATVKNHKAQDGVMTTNLGRVARAPAPKPPKEKKPRKTPATV